MRQTTKSCPTVALVKFVSLSIAFWKLCCSHWFENEWRLRNQTDKVSSAALFKLKGWQFPKQLCYLTVLVVSQNQWKASFLIPAQRKAGLNLHQPGLGGSESSPSSYEDPLWCGGGCSYEDQWRRIALPGGCELLRERNINRWSKTCCYPASNWPQENSDDTLPCKAINYCCQSKQPNVQTEETQSQRKVQPRCKMTIKKTQHRLACLASANSLKIV